MAFYRVSSLTLFYSKKVHNAGGEVDEEGKRPMSLNHGKEETKRDYSGDLGPSSRRWVPLQTGKGEGLVGCDFIL